MRQPEARKADFNLALDQLGERATLALVGRTLSDKLEICRPVNALGTLE
jgi:hypothetical protein